MSSACVNSCTRMIFIFLADLNCMILNNSALGLVCIHTSWVELVKASDKDHSEEN